MYSHYAFGNAEGPTKTHMESLQQFIKENNCVCGDSFGVYSSGKMEVPTTVDAEEEEVTVLFYQKVFAYNNTVEGQYAGSTPTKGGRVQTKYVCCHCHPDGELAADVYIDGKGNDRQ